MQVNITNLRNAITFRDGEREAFIAEMVQMGKPNKQMRKKYPLAYSIISMLHGYTLGELVMENDKDNE